MATRRYQIGGSNGSTRTGGHPQRDRGWFYSIANGQRPAVGWHL